MTLRSRDIFSRVPRLSETGAASSAAAGGALGAGGAAGWAGAAGAGWRAALAFSAASSTSCLRIRPPIPVPVRAPRSTPCCAASLRTSGVT